MFFTIQKSIAANITVTYFTKKVSENIGKTMYTTTTAIFKMMWVSAMAG
jgi:hypothetical protein